jgi:hypothetical protein
MGFWLEFPNSQKFGWLPILFYFSFLVSLAASSLGATSFGAFTFAV